MTTEPKYTNAQIEATIGHLEDSQYYETADMLRSLLSERQAAMQGRSGEVIELPDNIRVPLDEVIADLGYLFGRVAADGSFMKAAMDSTRLKLESARKAIVAALQPPQSVRSVSDEDVRDAYRWRHARKILPVEYIEQSQREFESYGLSSSEEENIAADKAIDAAIAQEKQS